MEVKENRETVLCYLSGFFTETLLKNPYSVVASIYNLFFRTMKALCAKWIYESHKHTIQKIIKIQLITTGKLVDLSSTLKLSCAARRRMKHELLYIVLFTQ